MVKSWVWDEVKSVYIDDKHEIGLDSFLEENHNVHVKSNMLAVMLVAAEKEFWETDQTTLEQISQKFADLIIENGLPGSGHTSPDSPIFPFIEKFINDAQRTAMQAVLKAATIDSQTSQTPSTISELNASDSDIQPDVTQNETTEKTENNTGQSIDYRWLFSLLALLMIIGIVRGAKKPTKHP